MQETIRYNNKHYQSDTNCKHCGSMWKYRSTKGCVDCCIRTKNNKRNDGRFNLYESARDRAKIKGIEFTITIDDIIIPDTCPVLGIPLKTNKLGTDISSSPSIDRIDNSKGYIKDNIAIISHRANTLKNDGTIEELELLIYFIEYGFSHPNIIPKH